MLFHGAAVTLCVYVFDVSVYNHTLYCTVYEPVGVDLLNSGGVNELRTCAYYGAVALLH